MTGLGSPLGWTLILGALAFLLYTYLGYPLLIRLLPTRLPSPGIANPLSLTSIVVVSREAGAAVARKAEHLLETVGIRLEIVVVLDGPDPEAQDALKKLGGDRVTVEALPQWSGKAAAINRAVAIARGEVLVFTDVRQRLAPGAVDLLVQRLASPDLGAVSGSFEFEVTGQPSLLDLYWRREGRLRSAEAAWHSPVGVTGGFYALKRAYWKPLPEKVLLDDLWVPMNVIRAGKRVGYETEATAIDIAFGPDEAELARKVRTMTGNYQLMLWMPWVLNPMRNPIWWQFVSHKVLRLLTPLGSAALLTGVLLIAAEYPLWLGGLALLLLLIGILDRRPGGLTWRGVRMARMGLGLQVALVKALLNALLQRWDVWTDPPQARSQLRARERVL